MIDYSPKHTPLLHGIVLTKDQALKTPEDQHFMTDKPYHEVLRSIMYTQVATRPDLSYAISTLSKFASNPGKPHWNAMIHVLHYIKGSLHFKITYRGKGHTDLAPVEYVDADYGSDLDMCHSCARQVFIQAGGPTSWGAQLLPTVALSTTEAEYMAVSWGAKQIK